MPYQDREAKRQYQREWVAKRRAAWFSGRACAHCGATTDLRLDHVDPTTKISHSIWSWSLSRREAELTKCQVLCEPCHFKKTALNNENSFKGEANGRAKLTPSIILALRQDKGSMKELAKKYGMTAKYVSAIRNKDRWKHL